MNYTNEEILAIERFTLSVTIPILLDFDDKLVLHATGTLFKSQDKHFIVTARHVFDGLLQPENLAYPEAPMGGPTHTFGKFEIIKPEQEHIDVAIMLLLEPHTIAKLIKSWQFLSLESIGTPRDDAPEGSFFVAGYPQKLTEPVGGWLSGKFVTAYTQRMPVAPQEAEAPVLPELDLFFDYNKRATLINGEEIDTPKLPGVSGASIWQARESTPGIWSPESAFRVVGVQSAFVHSKYMRAKSWWAVAKVLEKAGISFPDPS